MADPTPNQIRSAIVAAATARGVSQADLARAALMTRPQVSEYLAGKADVTTATASRMLKALGLEVRDGQDR